MLRMCTADIRYISTVSTAQMLEQCLELRALVDLGIVCKNTLDTNGGPCALQYIHSHAKETVY